MRAFTATSRRTRGAGCAAAVLAIATLAGCGDDESAQDRYCEAGESLESSISALFSVNVISDGTSGVSEALDAVRGDVEELVDSASDATSGDVDALNDAVDGLNDAVGTAGDDLSEENVNGVVDAIDGVRAAFGSVTETLSDC